MNFENKFLNGYELVGDDFSYEQIMDWYKDEADAYKDLFDEYLEKTYQYNALNIFHGFSRLPKDMFFEKTLAFGSAKGDELKPVLSRIGKFDLLDSSLELLSRNNSSQLNRVLVSDPTGIIDSEDSQYDLITCFGVLHHIPNVSFVIRELSRVLRPGGFLLIREPINSMGDWNVKRKGLTKRERGIPSDILNKIILSSNLRVVSKRRCVNPILVKVSKYIKVDCFNSKFWVEIDYIFSKLFHSNKYHRVSLFSKLFSVSDFYILTK